MLEEKNIDSGNPNTTNDGSSSDLIEALKEMKENSVPKADYEKLKAENKQIIDSYVKGKSLSTEEAPKPVDIEALNREILRVNNGLTSLEQTEKMLAVRNELIKRHGREADPFVNTGVKFTPTEEDFQAAQRVADVFQQCVDYADGDPIVFANELQRRTR